MKQLLSLSFIIILAAGCNSLTVKIPTARFQSPETPGEGGKLFGAAGFTSTNDVVLASDASSRPPTIGTPGVSNTGTDIPIYFGVGIAERFEIRGNASLFTSSQIYGLDAKFQPVGDTKKNAKKGNFATAVSVGYNTSGATNSGQQKGTFGPGGFPWKATGTANIFDGAIILGYRFLDWLQIYGGPFYQNISIKGNIHDDLSSDTTSPAADYTFTYAASQLGANLGFMFYINKSYLALEGVYSQFKINDATYNNGFMNFVWGVAL